MTATRPPWLARLMADAEAAQQVDGPWYVIQLLERFGMTTAETNHIRNCSPSVVLALGALADAVERQAADSVGGQYLSSDIDAALDNLRAVTGASES